MVTLKTASIPETRDASTEPRVPNGYKQTEVGVIPEDWEVKSSNEVGTPVRGGSPRPAGDPRYFNGSYIPWLTVAAMTNIPESQLAVSETATCLTEEGSSHSRTLTAGTLIIANSGATLGVAKILAINCCANDGIAALLNLSKGVSPYYLAHFINSKTKFLRDVVATGNGQPNLNTQLIGNFKFPLPPTKAEQDAIAEALSDADALIESLEHIVTKKRQIKQGTMQELLTGEKRLPGFENASGYKQTEVGVIPEDWDVVQLNEVTDKITVGFVGSMAHLFQSDGIPLLRGQNVLPHKLDFSNTKYISIDTHRLWNKSSLRPRDVVMVRVGYPGTSCVIPNNLGEANAASLVVVSPTKRRLDSDFLCYVVNSEFGRHQIDSYLVGGAQQVLNVKTAAIFKLPLPTKPEQEGIATVLSTMDVEMGGLEEKLAKTRQIKQGMMQELLSGKVRLV